MGVHIIMGVITHKIKLTASLSVISAAAAIAALPATANAWKVDHSASSICKDNKGAVSWSFKNTEPNKAKYWIDVEITDAQTGGKTIKTVKPGDSVSGMFTSSKTKLSSGKVYFKMLWTDGRSGVDTRSSSYKATDECKPFVEPAFNANVVCAVEDDKGVFTLNVRQTKGDATLSFEPKDGTKLPNGNPVTVTGAYSVDGTNKQKKVTTSAVADCTPEAKEIEVCRDGKVIVIKEDDRRETDADSPCPVETTNVCRNGEVVRINVDERKDTDTNAPCPKPQVEGTVTELPKTGAGSIAAVLGSTFALGTAFSQIKMRRNKG